MWQALRRLPGIGVAGTESAAELLQSKSRNIILTTGGLYAVWHVVALGVSTSEAHWYLLAMMPVVILTCALSLTIMQKHLLGGQTVWLIGLAGAMILSVYMLRQPEVAFSFVLLPLMAGLMVGWIAGLLAEGVVIALVVSLGRLGIMPGDAGYRLGIVAGGAFTAILGSVATSTLLTVARWSFSSWSDARRNLEAARQSQAELAHALEELDSANAKLQRANRALTAAWQRATDAERFKTEFLAKVSHEFRTPLNMIIGLTDLLVVKPEFYGEPLSPKLVKHLEIVHRNCDHLSSMVDDVLDLTQVEAGHMALHREWVDLAGIVEKVFDLVRPLVDSKHLDLWAEMPDHLPQVYCDRTRVSQVIVNLVSNAARFTEVGGISVHASQENAHVVISVADSGPGIEAEDATRIFEPFCQGTRKLWQDKGGSGLGLTISKQFVELHGGRIWLESEPGIGSTFFFSLPLSSPLESAQPPEQITSEGVHVEEPTSLPSPTPMEQRVVICDETGEVYPLVSRYWVGAECVDARTVEQAVQELKRVQAQSMLINAASPNELWTHVETARRSVPGTPIIGCCVSPKAERALAAGAVAYLVKPVTRSRLAEAIQLLEKPIKRVLVVDDGADEREVLPAILRAVDVDLEILTASDGTEALEALRSQVPDLLFLDIVMPGMNGWQLLAEKQRHDAMRDIPVVVVSAQDPREGPTISKFVLVTVGEGLSVSQLLHCSQQIPNLLLETGGPLRPERR